MSAADKTKLNGIAASANNYSHPNHSGDVTSAGDGAQTIAANAVSNTKLADMAASTIKGRVTASPGDPEDLTATQARSILNVADGATNTPLSSTTPAAVGTAAVGTGTTAARADHVHGHGNQAGGSLHSDATTSVSGFMSGTDKTKLNGIATSANNYSHPNHSGDVTSAGDGAQTIAANAVSNTKLADMAASTIKGRVTASTGDPEDLTATQARSILNVADGATNTPLSSTTPAAVGTAAVGTGTTAARADHVHGHGNQAGGSLHSAATTSANGFMSSTDKSKLDGIDWAEVLLLANAAVDGGSFADTYVGSPWDLDGGSF